MEPDATATHSVAVTDQQGCLVTADVAVEVIELAYGSNARNPTVQICTAPSNR